MEPINSIKSIKSIKEKNYQFFFYNSLESTMDTCKELFSKKDNSENICVVSKIQTKGRGTKNRTWHSKEGGLYFTFTIDLSKIKQKEDPTILIAVILKLFLQKFNSEITIKWFNDMYYKNKKLAGILCEKIDENYFLCGIGININNSNNDTSKQINSISLKEITANNKNNNNNKNNKDNETPILNLDNILIDFLDFFQENINSDLNYFENYIKENYILNKEINFSDEIFKVLNINKDYSLKLINKEEKIKIISWEETINNSFNILN